MKPSYTTYFKSIKIGGIDTPKFSHHLFCRNQNRWCERFRRGCASRYGMRAQKRALLGRSSHGTDSHTIVADGVAKRHVDTSRYEDQVPRVATPISPFADSSRRRRRRSPVAAERAGVNDACAAAVGRRHGAPRCFVAASCAAARFLVPSM